MSTTEGGANIVQDGLVFYFDSANPKSYISGSTDWNDLSKNLNNSVLLNGPTYNPNNKGGIVFDGINDVVNLNKNASQLGFANSSFTVEVWFNASITNNDSPLFSTNGGSTNTYLHYNLRSGALHMGFFFNDTSSSVPVLPNNFYCACFVYDISLNGGTQQIYQNGVSVASTGSHAPLSNGTDFKIGGNYNFGGSYTGLIYQVLGYNRALSSQEVLQNYNVIKPRFN